MKFRRRPWYSTVQTRYYRLYSTYLVTVRWRVNSISSLRSHSSTVVYHIKILSSRDNWGIFCIAGKCSHTTVLNNNLLSGLAITACFSIPRQKIRNFFFCWFGAFIYYQLFRNDYRFCELPPICSIQLFICSIFNMLNTITFTQCVTTKNEIL